MQSIRITNPQSINEYEINEMLEEAEVIIQFSDNDFSESLLTRIDNLCKVNSCKLVVRFYGHGFDPKKLLLMPNVKSLYLDCMRDIGDITPLKQLKCLEQFHFEVEYYDQLDFLLFENVQKVEYLALGQTKIKFDLANLKKFESIRGLVLVNQSKNIETISVLQTIENLSFHMIKNQDFNFLNQTKNVKKVRIIFGGLKSFEHIMMPSLIHLELIRIRGLESFGDVSRFQNLQYLQIEDQIQLKSLEIRESQNQLKRLLILNCKELNNLSGIENLESLVDLRLSKTSLEFSSFRTTDFPNQLETVYFATGRKKEDQLIEKQLALMGYKLMTLA